MATSLYVITNSSLHGNETNKDWEALLNELKELQLETTSIYLANGELLKESGNWEYEIENNPEEPFQVHFFGPFHIQPKLLKNIGILNTIYRYNYLFMNYDLDWFCSFRKDLYNIIKIMGGTEVIYLADNACDKLSTYLESMAWENVPYKVIKSRMIKEFGEPVKDFSKLNLEQLSYKNINEFFLDDFGDMVGGDS